MHTLLSPRLRPLLLALTFFLTNAACASWWADAQRVRHRHEQTAEHVYALAPDKVWAELARVAEEKGHRLAPPPPGAESDPRESDWRGAGGDTRHRYRMRVATMSGGRCKVEITKITEVRAADGGVATDGERDLDAEWLLLGRLDPDAAAKIEAAADARADQAYRWCSGCLNGPEPR